MAKDLPRAALLPLLLAATGAGAAAGPVDAAVAPARELLHFGPYDLLGELGRGGMGAVYLAEEREGARRRVALKVAHEAPASSAARAQLAFERDALASVAHEHVVRLFDAGTTPDGHPWLAMEYVDGQPLDAYCAVRALPLAERVRLLATVARAVQHLHERGVAHRDLKPANILVTEVDGRPVPKLIDLGFATPHAGGDAPTDTVAGTPAYMAPELFTAEAPSLPRADVYALGVVMYEVLAGTSPLGPLAAAADEITIGGAATPALGARRRDREVRALARAGLDDLIHRALAPDPHERPADAGALARELEALLARSERRARGWVGRVLTALGLRARSLTAP